MNIILLRKALIVVLFLAICSACSESEDTGNVQFNVRLTDAPGEYEEVNIDIQGVEVHANGGEEETGWVALSNINPGVYNLLDYTNDLDTLIASDKLPSGIISQVRLILGEDNTIKIEGETHALNIPSGEQSGLKLQVNARLIEGLTYNLLLDFDASKSVVKAGNSDKYNLKPVIRVVAGAGYGAISGNVLPVEAMPAIWAIAGADTIGTYADKAGNFFINGLKSENYKLVIMPKPAFKDTTLLLIPKCPVKLQI